MVFYIGLDRTVNYLIYALYLKGVYRMGQCIRNCTQCAYKQRHNCDFALFLYFQRNDNACVTRQVLRNTEASVKTRPNIYRKYFLVEIPSY